MNITVIHGPNLNMLSKRQTNIYGDSTLNEINGLLEEKAIKLGVKVDFFQSNSEGDIVSKIQQELGKADGIIINAAAYTHTSIAIRDALLAVDVPFVEVHLTNIYKRENFRRNSYLSDIAVGVVAGFGPLSYELALEALTRYIKAQARA